MSDHSIRDLVKRAFVRGDLSRESVEVLASGGVSTELVAGLNSNAQGGEVLLVTIVVDDSASIRHANAMEALKQGHNRLLDLLSETRGDTTVLVSTRFLNGKIINRYVPVSQAQRLNDQNYSKFSLGVTPLYYQSVLTLGTVMAQVHQLESEGSSVRSITLLITDGEEQSGHTTKPHEVAWLVRDLMNTGRALVAAYAVGYGAALEDVFTDMGIERKWIINSPDALSSLLAFAEAAVQASISQESFDRLLLGPGFGST